MLIDALMNSDVATVTPDHTVLSAARTMRDKNAGAVVVVDDEHRPIGLLTDRDITVKIVAAERRGDTPVDEIMSTPVHAVTTNSLVFDVLREMSERHVHRVPVVDSKRRLVGIVSVDDALMILTTELANVADVLVNRRAVS